MNGVKEEGTTPQKRYLEKEEDKERTCHVEIEQGPEFQGSRNLDLQFKSKAV